ncbi:MAG: hypothetical protein ABSF46_32505, partial [Terriglobia bacterium]
VGLLPLALAGLHVERVIYKVNSFQFTRSARLVLALQRNANGTHLCATRLLVALHFSLDKRHSIG